MESVISSGWYDDLTLVASIIPLGVREENLLFTPTGAACSFRQSCSHQLWIQIIQPGLWCRLICVVLLNALGFRLFSYTHLQNGGEPAGADHEDQRSKMHVRVVGHQLGIIVIRALSNFHSCFTSASGEIGVLRACRRADSGFRFTKAKNLGADESASRLGSCDLAAGSQDIDSDI